jgi:hypothetical protein
MRNQFLCLSLLLTLMTVRVAAQDSVTVRHWGGSVNFNPGYVLNMHHYTDRYDVPERNNRAFSAELNYSPLPSDSDVFASDYNYPTYGVGVKYAINNSIRFSRLPDYEWIEGDDVDYDSYVGNTWAFYGFFSRPLLRTSRWMADFTVNAGIAYSHTKYDTHYNVDNELIGARWLIFFGAGLHLSYRFAPYLALKGGVDFWHLSNGALNRPNKGVNFVGPSIGLSYIPYYEALASGKNKKIKRPFNKYWYAEVSAGIGAKTLEEDWNMTQFELPSDAPRFQTEHFHLYMAYSAQADVMYRYARRWATGAGVDVNYGEYASRIEERDKEKGYTDKHSPWSLGISLKHQVFYHNVSMHASVGYYLHREMGHRAKSVEKRYYETVGLRYSIPALNNLSVGFDVKAHFLKADYTQLVLSYPIRFADKKD